MTTPISLEEAWARLLSLAAPIGSETIPVDQCSGRYLAQDLIALRDQPAHDLSAMDGFAVFGSGPWTVVGESRAGHPFDGSLSPGEAVSISTGAHCPPGTESILIQEDAERAGAALAAMEAPSPGRHIRRKGFDFARKQTLLAAGAAVGPAQLALARSAGHDRLAVGRRPRVAVIECGDELVADPRDCPPDRLPASNGAMLAAMAASVGADSERCGLVPDDQELLARAFEDAGAADIIVTSGGASVGPHDLIRPVLLALGAEIDFWKVAIRPGKPILLGRRGRQLILGLPGNPVSSFVTCFLFLLPLIRHLQGATSPFPRPLPLPLARNVGAGGERREFLRGTLGEAGVTPMDERDSSALGALSRADVLIDRSIGAKPLKAGALVPCHVLEMPGIA